MIKKGDYVKVKEGVSDYAHKHIDLSNWQGYVLDIHKDNKGLFIEVQWDSLTLNQMPFDFIERCIADDVEFDSYILLENDVVRSIARDTEANIHKALIEIDKKYFESEE
jgi:hypothetical protein